MNSGASLRSLPPSVAALFIRMYRVASAWQPEERALASMEQPVLDRYALAALERNDEGEAVASLHRVVPLRFTGENERGEFLAIMRAIDNVFHRVHPRMRMGGPSLSLAPYIPTWLRTVAEQRLASGLYAEEDGFRLLPRGPLLRTSRMEDAASAEVMADRFVGLSMVPTLFEHDGRSIRLRHAVVHANRLTGIGEGNPGGSERIVHIPLAISPDELSTAVQVRASTHLFEFSFGAGSPDANVIAEAAATKFVRIAAGAPRSDILMAPEFVVPAAAANAISDQLSQAPLLQHRLIAAGSGLSVERPSGMAWNEMHLFNNLGVKLWSQRKLWPASVAPSVAECVGHSLPAGGKAMEAIRSGQELWVVDIETLGRCVVLICQDIKLFGLNTLLHHLQCDWVLVPVLDTGVLEGRWTHRATFAVSEDNQTRFIVGSSLALLALQGKDISTPCLLALGPRAPADDADLERALTLRSIEDGGQFVVLEWRAGDWQMSKLVADTPALTAAPPAPDMPPQAVSKP